MKKRFKYEVQRETFDCSRHSTSIVSAESIRLLGAPREKMWVSRTVTVKASAVQDGGEIERQVFVERVTKDPAFRGIDDVDGYVGRKVERSATQFRTAFNEKDVIHQSWEAARNRIVRLMLGGR